MPQALQFLAEHKQDFNIRRLKRLNVSGAFHSSHMEPAAEELKEVRLWGALGIHAHRSNIYSPRDVSLSDSKCWNDGQKWVK